MPWKEPGDKPRDNRNRGPWGPGQGGPSGGGPDLEASLKKLQRKLGPFGRGPLGVLAVVVLLLVLWFVIGGWTRIDSNEVGLLLRFGRLEAVLQPGLHLRLPAPLDQVHKVDTARTRTISDDVRLLTSDGQLAIVDYYVQYKVADARKFLFAARDAEETARNAATIAMRAEVGSRTLRQLMDRSDDKLGDAVQARLRATLARADIGVEVTGVGVQKIGVPSDVKQAFDDIARAHEDAAAAQATAKADVARNKVETQARAAAMKAAATKYRETAVADAKAAVARFDQVLEQYRAAPAVTRHRLWLDAMQDVLTRNHVVLNTGSGNVIVQFPPPAKPAAIPASSASSAPAGAASAPAAAGSSVPPVTSGPATEGPSA